MSIFTINRRYFSSLPSIEVELGAEYDGSSESVRLGAAIKIVVGKAKQEGARADLAGANLAGANLARANLARANLARANLAGANLAGAYLADAYLAGANLARAYLADAYLAGANLARANLAGADLAGANLAGADLADAYLAGANLADAYLAGAVNIEPEEIPVITNIDAAILAAIEAGGKLDMGAWHKGNCGTTHCRAGWAIHLAGEKGYALEAKVGSQMAGAMIYRASRPGESAPWFFASDEEALDDIRECAARQLGS